MPPPDVETRMEGPFGDHFGHYSEASEFPVFHVKTVTRRRNAIYPATVVGKPRQEDFFIGDLLQELLSPLFPLVMPAVDIGSCRAKVFKTPHSVAAAGDVLNPLALCKQIDAQLADDSVIVADGGDFVATASYILRPRGALGWLDPGVFGTWRRNLPSGLQTASVWT